MKHIALVFGSIMLISCATPQAVQAKKNAMARAIADNSTVLCDSKEKCDKIFRVATDVAVQYSDMKIQSQGANNLSTYNPYYHGDIGASVQRVMVDSNSEKINFYVVCKGMYDNIIGNDCYDKVTGIYDVYKARVAEINAESKQGKKSKRQ